MTEIERAINFFTGLKFQYADTAHVLKHCDVAIAALTEQAARLDPKPQTNLDYIRAKSAKEFASMLVNDEFPSSLDYGITFCDLCAKGGNTMKFTCVDCLTHWLEQPYKEDNNATD